MSTNMNLIVLSVNAWSGRKYNCIEEIIKTCNKYKVDIICLQESPEEKKLEEKLVSSPYKIIFWGGHQYGDYLAILVNTNIDWKYKNIQVNTKLCNTKRIGVSCILTHPKWRENICIANVHLCGGGPDESEAARSTEYELIKMKEETLKLLLEKSSPSLIVGDFNSDLNHFHTKIGNPEHIKYLKNKDWTSNKIKIWNFTPFQFMKKMGLSYAMNGDYVKPTSFSGTTPDAIWYDKTIWQVINFTKIDFMKNKKLYSDHDGLLINLYKKTI